MSERLKDIQARLQAHDQGHLLAFYDQLDSHQQSSLLDQIESLDLDGLDELIETFVRNKPDTTLPTELQPAPYYDNIEKTPDDYTPYREAGEELIRGGKLAAFTVAGGQGTRLGWNGPKGTYPATVVTGKPLFRVFAEQILAAEKKWDVTIPWLIMTSPINDADTRAFFQDNNHFGLNPRDIFMFPQGVMPSLDARTGRLLLADKSTVGVNPDGHGGSFKALRTSGAIEDLASRGIEHISYVQVDNPLAKVIDPLFIGLHATAPDSSGEMSSKMVPKTMPEEKVGVFCQSKGKTMVIEYSDLPDELARRRDESGNLRFNAGSIAIHLVGVDFAKRLTDDSHQQSLPLHRAVKKVSYVDPETGRRVDPAEPNAVKLEAFVFDALELADASIVYETSRVEEFAPIKNAEGVDSPATSHQLQCERDGKWLESRGVKVFRRSDGEVNAKIEISPLTAMEPADLAADQLPDSIEADSVVVF